MTGPTTERRPLVSIVTPTLQRATFLERTLRSVRAQQYSNVEHIVVDGGSTDGTLELLERYSGTYNLRWISEPDRGMYDAINKGLRLASGEILAYLNSDDQYFPWSVRVGVDTLVNHPTIDLVFGDVIRVDEIRDWVVPVFVAPFSIGSTASYGTLIQPAVLLRRRVLEALGGFDDTLRFVADLDFWLRAADRFAYLRIPEFLALEYRHGATLSETKRDEMAEEDRRVRHEFRRGMGATRVGRFAAHARWHWWAARSWIAFVRATRGRGTGWDRTIEACRPSLSAGSAIMGLMPSKASRLRSTIRWSADPRSVSSADAGEHG